MALIARWKLFDNLATTAVIEDGGNYAGIANANTNVLHAMGRLQRHCFDLDGQYQVDIGDDAVFSFGNGTVDSPFSIVVLVYVTDSLTEQQILSKYDDGDVAREWRLYLKADECMVLYLFDESEDVSARRITDAALTVGWHVVGATYAGQAAAGATAANFITLYVDGREVASTAANNGAYDAMEALGSDIVIGGLDGGAIMFKDKIADVSIFDTELTAAKMLLLSNKILGIGGRSAMRKLIQGF